MGIFRHIVLYELLLRLIPLRLFWQKQFLHHWDSNLGIGALYKTGLDPLNWITVKSAKSKIQVNRYTSGEVKKEITVLKSCKRKRSKIKLRTSEWERVRTFVWSSLKMVSFKFCIVECSRSSASSSSVVQFLAGKRIFKLYFASSESGKGQRLLRLATAYTQVDGGKRFGKYCGDIWWCFWETGFESPLPMTTWVSVVFLPTCGSNSMARFNSKYGGGP